MLFRSLPPGSQSADTFLALKDVGRHHIAGILLMLEIVIGFFSCSTINTCSLAVVSYLVLKDQHKGKFLV